jgi:hypothetical protein
MLPPEQEHLREALEAQMWKSRADEQDEKDRLYFAMRSRVLTEDEMKRVEHYQERLLTRDGRPYYEEEIVKQFNAALLQQFQIRTLAMTAELAAKPKPDPSAG